MLFRARMTCFLGVFVCLFVASVVTEELTVCLKDTSTDCCLCAAGKPCDSACPGTLNLFVTDRFQYECKDTVAETTTGSDAMTTTSGSVAMTTATNMETTSNHNNADNSTKLSETDHEFRTRQLITVCLIRCPDGYFPVYQNCTKCGPVCRTCLSGPSDCLECKFIYNDSCHADCPEGTHPVGSNCTENKRENDDEKLPLKIIIGASAGGGALVVILIVTVICCCCRRKRCQEISESPGKTTGRKTVMSGILEEKNGSGTTKPKGMGTNGSRVNYENTPKTDKSLSHTIPRQGDVVLRYTKDPTEQVKINTSKQTEPEPVNRDSTYTNAFMISMMKKLGHKNMTPETIEEQLDIEALPEAPRVPPGASKGEAGVPQAKTKISLAKRVSQKFSKKRKPKEKDKEPEDTLGQSYVDMSYQGGEGQSIETVEHQPEEQEDYENALERKPKNKPNTSKAQIGLQNQPKSRTVQTGLQSQPKSGKVQADLKNQSKTSKTQTGLIKSDIGKSQTGSEELEDYENAPAKLIAQSEPSDKKRVDGELEDYENMAKQKLRKTGEKVDEKVKGKTGLKMEDNMQGKALKVEDKAKADDENDLEDYENAKVVKPSSKTKQLMEKFERQKKNEKVVRNIESDDLEDYENTKKLSKKGKIGETQEKFENKQRQSKVNKMVKKTENAEALDSLEDYENMGPLSKKENPEDNSEKHYENMEIVRKTLKKRKA